MNKCSECRATHYCSLEFQRKDWPVHKIMCNKIKLLREKAVPLDNILTDLPINQVENVYLLYHIYNTKDFLDRCNSATDISFFELMEDFGPLTIYGNDIGKVIWPP
jgi:hypothetical protein